MTIPWSSQWWEDVGLRGAISEMATQRVSVFVGVTVERGVTASKRCESSFVFSGRRAYRTRRVSSSYLSTFVPRAQRNIELTDLMFELFREFLLPVPLM